MDQHSCPFCHVEESRIIVENETAVVFPDAFPVADGHVLVVPKRHVASLFDLSDEEQISIWKLVALVRGKLVSELHPEGFNVGVNDGVAAGQTVLHAHVHLIPRRTGDVANPRGGIRWLVPTKARYWVEEEK
jgi:diadenosine tetraphosphate (Ap4A) HIT family hydrolase